VYSFAVLFRIAAKLVVILSPYNQTGIYLKIGLVYLKISRLQGIIYHAEICPAKLVVILSPYNQTGMYHAFVLEEYHLVQPQFTSRDIDCGLVLKSVGYKVSRRRSP
jgi:hypothetical protein